MRGHIRKYRRDIFFAVFLFFVLGFILYNMRDSFFVEFRQFIENKISRQFNAEVKVGKFEGGFLNRLSFGNLSVHYKDKDLWIVARRVYFNLRFSDIIFKRYKSLDPFYLSIEKVSFFKQNACLPVKVARARFYFSKGFLRVEDLRGSFGDKIPFEAEATVVRFLEDNPSIKIKCRFLSVKETKEVSLPLPAVIYLDGDLSRLLLKGYWNDAKRTVFDIVGNIQPLSKVFSFSILPQRTSEDRFDSSSTKETLLSSAEMFKRVPKITVTGDFSMPGLFNIRLALEHLNFRNNDLLTNIVVEGGFIPQKKLVQGKIYSAGSVLNYQPLPEFKGFFRLKDGEARVSSLRWGEIFLLSGLLNFGTPLSGNLSILINNFNLELLATLFYPTWSAFGSLRGKLKFDIGAQGVNTRGEINLSEGIFGPFKFKGGRILLAGEKSIMTLANSKVYNENGYFELGGEVDFRKLGQPDFGRKMTMTQNQSKIEWQGWNISRKDGLNEQRISAGKGIDEKFSVGFNAYVNNEERLDSAENQNEFDLEYKLEDDKSLKIRLKENEELLGVERKVKF
jgi:hypothetical protein